MTITGRSGPPAPTPSRAATGTPDRPAGRPPHNAPDLVLGPSRQPFPNRLGVRTSRISVTGTTMTLRLAGRPTRTVPLAADAASRLVARRGERGLSLLRVPRDDAGRLADPAADPFVASAEHLVTISTRSWGAVGGIHPLAPADWLSTSGFDVLFDRLDIPLHRRTQPDPPEVARRLSAPGAAVDPAPPRPRWLARTRAVAFGGLVLTLPVGGLPLPVFVLPAGLGLLAVVLGLADLARAARADRASTWQASAALRARPVGFYTRRFTANAQLGLVGDELVAVDGVGAEEWLPLVGATRAARFVVVREGEQLVGVRLEREDGVVLAALPGEDWFGPDYDPNVPRPPSAVAASGRPGQPPPPPGELVAFAAACGLPVSTVTVALDDDDGDSLDGDGIGDRTWSVAVAESYSCKPPREVFDSLARRTGLPMWVPDAVAFAAGACFATILLVAAAVNGKGQFVAPGILFAATALLCFLRYTVPALYRRLWWDRPRSTRPAPPSPLAR